MRPRTYCFEEMMASLHDARYALLGMALIYGKKVDFIGYLESVMTDGRPMEKKIIS